MITASVLKGSKKKRFRKKATTKNVASIPVKRVLRKIFHSSCLLGVKKCSFFGKFGMLCFLKTPVLRFALLPCYRCILDASYSPGYAPDYIFLKNMQLHWGTLKWISNLIKSWSSELTIRHIIWVIIYVQREL